MNVVQAYQEALRARGFVADSAQQAAVMRLQALSDALDRFRVQRSGLLGRLVRRPSVPRGVWLYGGVGRGKSF